MKVIKEERSVKKKGTKKKWYFQTFRKEWMDDPDLKDWLLSVPNEKHSSFCKICKKKFIHANKSFLKHHFKTKRHKLRSSLFEFPADANKEVLEYNESEELFEENQANCASVLETTLGNDKIREHQADTSMQLSDLEILGMSWAVELKYVTPEQSIHAKKGIHDILYEAQLGTLNRNSIKINQEPNISGDDANYCIIHHT